MGQVVDRSLLMDIRARMRADGRRIVFTNGVFDILHRGHCEYLGAARACGDALIVGLNSDASVRRIKGERKPIVPQGDRAYVLASLACVDYVTLFDEDTPGALIAALVPDVLVKGADWSHWIAGREIVEGAGGSVQALPLEPDYSTTDIEKRILSLEH